MEDKERHQCILGSRSLSHLCPLAGPSLTCQISSCSLFVSLHIICICLLNAHLILFESYTYMLHYIDAQVQCHFEDEICCQALAAWTVRVLLPQFHAIHVDKPLTIPTLLLFEKNRSAQLWPKNQLFCNSILYNPVPCLWKIARSSFILYYSVPYLWKMSHCSFY